jgi:hypothetical protein
MQWYVTRSRRTLGQDCVQAPQPGADADNQARQKSITGLLFEVLQILASTKAI